MDSFRYEAKQETYDEAEYKYRVKRHKYDGPKPDRSSLSLHENSVTKMDVSQFLKTWKHIPISRSGKVKTSLYHECCDGSCSLRY